ncbi:MAG TPA: hypothetical protein VFI31_03955, partial [Pirellulales bacterium]|nr:hypothetical protein [Pirellulales bacterium]
NGDQIERVFDQCTKLLIAELQPRPRAVGMLRFCRPASVGSLLGMSSHCLHTPRNKLWPASWIIGDLRIPTTEQACSMTAFRAQGKSDADEPIDLGDLTLAAE